MLSETNKTTLPLGAYSPGGRWATKKMKNCPKGYEEKDQGVG